MYPVFVSAELAARRDVAEARERDGRLVTYQVGVRDGTEVLVEGALDDACLEAAAFQGGGDAGLAVAGIAGTDEELGRGVPLDDDVKVHKPELDTPRCGAGQHAEGPGVGLPEVAEPEEPEAGWQVPQCWPVTSSVHQSRSGPCRGSAHWGEAGQARSGAGSAAGGAPRP
jgi:hypothetical protein